MPASKQDLRERVWGALQEQGAARFPGARGRIPNFKGAEDAARRLAGLPEWREARVLKCNPDSPQRPVRHAALKAGKRVFMAAPKLADEQPFLELDPERLDEGELWEASSIKGAGRLARAVGADALPAVDLIVTGCVGVARDGARLGKGGGYSDLEYALLRELGVVDERTPILTTVHPLQVLRRGDIPREPHDISLDAFVLPGRVVRCPDRAARPRGLDWSALDEERIEAMPVLAALRRGG